MPVNSPFSGGFQSLAQGLQGKAQKEKTPFDPWASIFDPFSKKNPAAQRGLDILTGLSQDRNRYMEAIKSGISGSYESARSGALQAKGAARQGAVNEGKQQTGAAQQSMAQRGMFNTTVMDNAKAGISSAVTQNLAQIEAATSQVLGGLDIAEGQAMANVGQMQMDVAQQNAMDLFSLVSGVSGFGPHNRSLFTPGSAWGMAEDNSPGGFEKVMAGLTSLGGLGMGLGAMGISDRRLKKNVKILFEGKPNVVQWEWNDDAKRLFNLEGTQIGYIAQDVQEYFPDAVSVGEDGYLRIDYSKVPTPEMVI